MCIRDSPRADTSSRRNAAAARTAAEADADEILEDERHREGRLLAKWRARVKDQDVAPRAVLAFANRFAEDVCDAFSGKEHRASLASLAARRRTLAEGFRPPFASPWPWRARKCPVWAFPSPYCNLKGPICQKQKLNTQP